MRNNWIFLSLLNFFIAALMGLILRGAFLWEITWLDYRHWLHAHSHVAMLGWAYLALYVLIGTRFIPREIWSKPFYARLFWFTQITVIGMMFTFPVQGYGPVSITFSTLHVLASYVFCYRGWKDMGFQHKEVRTLMGTALVFLVISTLGVWSLGPLAMSGQRSSILYQLVIQFYLHFQFHGWFTFAVLALLLDIFLKGPLSHRLFTRFYYLLLGGTVLTYSLVINWGYSNDFALLLNGIGLLMQFMALILVFHWFKNQRKAESSRFDPIAKMFFMFGAVSWILKVIVQTLVIIPQVAVISYNLRPLMIGFIHLTMLGFVSGFLLGILFHAGVLKIRDGAALSGARLFIIGFVVTELLLFVQGLFYWMRWGQLPYYYELIFGASVLLPLGILVILLNQARSNGNHLKVNLS